MYSKNNTHNNFVVYLSDNGVRRKYINYVLYSGVLEIQLHTIFCYSIHSSVNIGLTSRILEQFMIWKWYNKNIP